MADDVKEVETVEEVEDVVVIKDVFDDSTEDVSTEKGAEEVEAKAETTEEAEETKTEVEETAEGEPPSSNKEAGQQAALVAERRLRQTAQRAYNELKAERAEEEATPDPVTDPDGYAKYLMDRQDKLALETKIKMSQVLMRKHHEDYDDTEKVFMSLIGSEDDDGLFTVSDDTLLKKMHAADSPGDFAYTHAKKHLDFVNKSADDYETNLEKKIEAKIRKEYEDKGITGLPDLTNAAASASNTDKAVEISENYLWDDEPAG